MNKNLRFKIFFKNKLKLFFWGGGAGKGASGGVKGRGEKIKI